MGRKNEDEGGIGASPVCGEWRMVLPTFRKEGEEETVLPASEEGGFQRKKKGEDFTCVCLRHYEHDGMKKGGLRSLVYGKLISLLPN